MSNHSSTYQTSFEKKILNKYSQDKKQNYLKAKIYENIHADFEDENNIEIGEIYAGIESLKPGQIKKIIADCFKLNYLNDFCFEQKRKKIILVICEQIQTQLTDGKSWYSRAINFYNITVDFVKMEDADIAYLREIKMFQGKDFK